MFIATSIPSRNVRTGKHPAEIMTGEGEMQSVPPDDSDGQQITWAKTGVSIGRIWFSWSSSQSVSFKYG